jgi:hypothetical protein
VRYNNSNNNNNKETAKENAHPFEEKSVASSALNGGKYAQQVSQQEDQHPLVVVRTERVRAKPSYKKPKAMHKERRRCGRKEEA